MLRHVLNELKRALLAPRHHRRRSGVQRSFVDGGFTDIQARLGIRAESFRQTLRYLESLAPPYLIVETGTARTAGNWAGDGQSTLIWDAFVQFWGGRVTSVDIDAEAVKRAQLQVSARTSVVCADSIGFLRALKDADRVHLLYLDSYDLDLSNPHPSALHHLMELASVLARLRAGTLVVVDDCHAAHVGKHIYVRQYFESIGVAPLFAGYQTGWVVPAR
jgi:predicted O-methyltransferase YrrM